MLLRFLPKRTPSLQRFVGVRFMSRSSESIFGDSCPLVVTPRQVLDAPAGSVTMLDASWHMPNSPRKGKDEFYKTRIPHARFLDLDEVASPNELGLKHMMPSGEKFATSCELLGITPQSHVVIYDSHGVFSSPRALFMFRAFGHERSSILNGGLPNWRAHGGPLETGHLKPAQEARYRVPKLNNFVLRSYEQMISNAQDDPSEQSFAEFVLDARSKGRYLGSDPEPRPGLSSGHMPHSLSLPFNAFLDTTTFKPSPDAEEVSFTTLCTTQKIIENLREALGDDKLKEVMEGKRGVVTSCGSGMTAGVLWLGLKLLGVDRVALYDESWTGYAMRDTSPIVKSE